MQDRAPIPGRVKPTRYDLSHKTAGEALDWRPQPKRMQEAEDRGGILICPRCHAISDHKRWYFDEPHYQQLKKQEGVTAITCPGCTKLDRQIYEGEVRLRSPLLAQNKEQAMGMIRHEEQRVMEENPLARLAVIQDHGEEIDVITTSAFLAERIGKQFKKAFHGHLRIDSLPYEKFSRVWWDRD